MGLDRPFVSAAVIVDELGGLTARDYATAELARKETSAKQAGTWRFFLEETASLFLVGLPLLDVVRDEAEQGNALLWGG